MDLKVSGQKDRRIVENRSDVLVHTLEPLKYDCEITGPVTAALYAASSAIDTDFTITLIDVHPDGMTINICEGFRRSHTLKTDSDPVLI